MAPDHRAVGLGWTEHGTGRISGRKPTLRMAELGREKLHDGDKSDNNELEEEEYVMLHGALHHRIGTGHSWAVASYDRDHGYFGQGNC